MTLLLLLLTLSLAPQTADLTPPPAPAGWEEPGIRFFERDDLFNHINGGAEIFLEAGFVHLTVCQYRQGTRTLDLEAYRFDDPLGALALFLQLNSSRGPKENPSQLCLRQGVWLLLLNNPSGDPALLPAMKTLLQQVSSALPAGREPRPFQTLPQTNRIPGSERLVYGPYSLQNLFTLGEGDILRLQEHRLFAPSAQYGPGTDPWTLLQVTYPREAQSREVLRGIRKHLDPYLEVLQDEPDHLVIRDFRQKYGEILREGSRLTLRWDLGQPPG